MNQGTIGGYWPLYEDGTPVRIGDTVDGHEGHYAPMVVKCVKVVGDATVIADGVWSTVIMPGKRLKRYGGAPEGTPCLCRDPDGDVETKCIHRDEPNWHIVIDGVRYGVSNHARSRIAEALDLTTSRQTLPSGIEWPEVDGEPVMPGDTLWDDEGFMIDVTGVEFKGDGYCVLHVFDEHIMNVAHTIGTTSKCFSTLTRTEPEPVFDRDGVPIEVGDTVYRDDGSAHTVNRLLRGKRFNVRTFSETGNVVDICKEDLTHQPPDSWERLAEDARKSFVDYWSCEGIECIDCPAMVDGKAPYERYRTSDCAGGGGAMDADIAARVRALAGVMDDE